MLNGNPAARADSSFEREEENASSKFDLTFFVRIAKQQWPVILAVLSLCIFGTLAYMLTVQPRFTATVGVMIDTRKNQLLSAQQQVVGDQTLDAGGLDSQAEILKSESVALSVIRELKLAGDPEFTGNANLLLALWDRFFGDEPSDYEKERHAVEIFAKDLSVKRVGVSYVISVDFTCYSAGKAAQIGNAIADAYMVNELESRYQATRRASRWLQDRIGELREQASAADRNVQKYRAENNIVDTSRGLLSEQQLGDVNTQLITARAATAEAKARLDRITEIGGGDIPNATVADALKNDVIIRLRAQYLDLAAREADWSSRFGVNHSATVNLRNQMREIRRSVSDEVQRIAETYKSEYEISRAREQSIQLSLATLIDTAGTTGQAQVKLRDLESTAQSYRNLYDSFLQRFMEATQQQTFPVPEARVITVATAPLKKSWPRGIILLPAGTIAGLLLGFGAAFVRERLDNVYRTPAQVEAGMFAECLGLLPRVVPIAMPPTATSGERKPGVISPEAISRYVLDAPFSRFTETMRSVKVAVDLSGLDQRTRVVGIVSSLPNEGKTTVSANLAFLMAQTGNKVLLIDGDLRRPNLTASLASGAKAGIVEVLSGQKTVADVLVRDAGSGLEMIPAVLNGRIWHTAEMLSSSAMTKLLDAARNDYDYVIIDLPPIVPVVDVRAVSHLIDGFVMVVEWGSTSRDAVKEAVSTVESLRKRMIGVVLNKANASVLKRLEGYKGKYYKSYYTDRTDAAA